MPRPNTEAPLVGTDWLADQLGAPDLRVFDGVVRLRPATPGPYVIESGRADFDCPKAVTVSFAKRFIGAENLPTRLSEFDVQQSICLRADDIAAIAERFRPDRRVAAANTAPRRLRSTSSCRQSARHGTRSSAT